MQATKSLHYFRWLFWKIEPMFVTIYILSTFTMSTVENIQYQYIY